MEKLTSVQIVAIELQRLLRYLSEIRRVIDPSIQITGMKRIVNLPKHEIKKSDDKTIKALRMIADKGGKITKKDLADKKKIIEVISAKENSYKVRY